MKGLFAKIFSGFLIKCYQSQRSNILEAPGSWLSNLFLLLNKNVIFMLEMLLLILTPICCFFFLSF